ncbi:androgen-induced gene 1 protein isoform X11 [Phyllostomus discolor]|uniref:Androgen-induced gene 1 protein isoform X11 n=1 Tax=Phyllostomus discolor TaxID=89673 RepID=A0A7E6DPG4_9CHIR|nr:androgen-induced gene 1 protein isoform X11 [Phyllostomus discolor]
MALVPCQVLRVAILLSYCSILCNYKAIEMPSHQTYGGSWKFLTFIDLVLSRVPIVGSSCSNCGNWVLSNYLELPLQGPKSSTQRRESA